MNRIAAWPRRRGAFAALACALLAGTAPAGWGAVSEPALVMMQSAPGRFEIAARDPSLAQALVVEAVEAWRVLSAPLGLPEAFPSPIFLRVEADANGTAEPFRVAIEAGGIVSVRLRESARSTGHVRRALVQGLLLRLAVARHGVTPHLVAPLWLELAGVEWWRTRADAARLDAAKQVAGQAPPAALGALLLWRRGGEESAEWTAAALWLLTFLQAESGPGQEWLRLLGRLLAGDDPLVALVQCYPGRYRDPGERELWWQTGYHHARRIHALPVLEAADSRTQLAALVRFVAADNDGLSDRVVPLREMIARRAEPLLTVELRRRAEVLARVVATLHPFYRNAGLSLAEVFAIRDQPPRGIEVAIAAFERDWQDANELSAATAAALDRLAPP